MSLQSKILRHLEATPGVWAVKVEVANFRGCPDILACVCGRFLAIEVKEGENKLSEIQNEQIKRISHSGGIALIVRNFDDFVLLLKDEL